MALGDQAQVRQPCRLVLGPDHTREQHTQRVEGGAACASERQAQVAIAQAGDAQGGLHRDGTAFQEERSVQRG